MWSGLERQKKFNVIFAVILVICMFLIAISKIELPLSEGEIGEKFIVATVKNCEIHRLAGSFRQKHSAVISLQDHPKKMLLNFHVREMSKIEAICNLKMRVEIRYHVIRLLLRPAATEAIDSIEPINSEAGA